MKVYLVGGAVRDKLLDNPSSDKDWVVVGATPQELLNLGYIRVGQDFPVFLHPKTNEEYALARTERKSGKGYKGFTCEFDPSITLESDLARRDLTINAIAMADDGSLIDPFHGQQDIQMRILRHVSDAFIEDPLRVLRVARFAARFHHLGFKIAPETELLMNDMVSSGEVSALTPERVWIETEKALATQDPQVYFEVLKNCGALAVLFPYFSRFFNVYSGHKSLADYTLIALKISADLQASHEQFNAQEIRFAIFCHNLDKAPNEDLDESIKQGLTQIIKLCDQYKVPNHYKKLACSFFQSYWWLQQSDKLNPQQLIVLFSKLNLWRNPKQLPQFLFFYRILSMSYKVDAQKISQIERYLKTAYSLVCSIDVQEIIAQGFQGKAIDDELTNRRIIALESLKID